jgi:hypothetical protein
LKLNALKIIGTIAGAIVSLIFVFILAGKFHIGIIPGTFIVALLITAISGISKLFRKLVNNSAEAIDAKKLNYPRL